MNVASGELPGPTRVAAIVAASRQREQERFEILVLGKDRPKTAPSTTRVRGKRRVIKPQPVELDPSIEQAVQVRERWSHKAQGTPETHEHFSKREGALTRLLRTGAINEDQKAWAEQIADAAEIIARDVSIGGPSYEPRMDCSARAYSSSNVMIERLAVVRREMAYSRWRDRLPQPRQAILDMIVADDGLTIVARRYRIHPRKARRLLIEALDAWPQYTDLAARLVDEADLEAMKAGLT